MLGAIAGSVHERARTKYKNFPLLTPASCFTDDTVLGRVLQPLTGRK